MVVSAAFGLVVEVVRPPLRREGRGRRAAIAQGRVGGEREGKVRGSSLFARNDRSAMQKHWVPNHAWAGERRKLVERGGFLVKRRESARQWHRQHQRANRRGREKESPELWLQR